MYQISVEPLQGPPKKAPPLFFTDATPSVPANFSVSLDRLARMKIGPTSNEAKLIAAMTNQLQVKLQKLSPGYIKCLTESVSPPPPELTRKVNKYTMCCSPPPQLKDKNIDLGNQTCGPSHPTRQIVWPLHQVTPAVTPVVKSLSNYQSRHSCSHSFSTHMQSHVHTPSQVT